MLSIEARDGITHIVATPHYRHGEFPSAWVLREKIALVREGMAKRSIDIELIGRGRHKAYI